MDRILPALSSPQMKSRMTAVDDLQVRRPPFASDATTPPSRRRSIPVVAHDARVASSFSK